MKQYLCKNCCFYTFKSNDFNRHLRTKKHMINSNKIKNDDSNNDNDNNSENNDIISENTINEITHVSRPSNYLEKLCIFCNKIYSTKQSLSIHMEKCKEKHKHLPNNNLTIDSVKQILQNKEIMTEIIKTVAICNESSLHLSNNGSINNGTINNGTIYNGNINNGTVNNLNLFFDTKCKDAMNLSEFFEALQVTNSDVENMGRNGFSTGIYEIIDKGLKECGLYKRPIHCTDIKRETLYIKENDKWQKDDPDNPTVRKYIKDIRIKSIEQSKKWKESHPNSEIIGSNEYEFWFYIMNNINNGGVNEIRNYNKIVSCISRTTDISAMRRDRALM